MLHTQQKTARQLKKHIKGGLSLRMKAAQAERDTAVGANQVLLDSMAELLKKNKLLTQLLENSKRDVKVCKDFVAEASVKGDSTDQKSKLLRTELDAAKTEVLAAKTEVLTLRKRSRDDAAAAVLAILQPSPYKKLFWFTEEKCISTSRAKLLLALKVAPFLAFQHKLKIAEVRSQKDLKIEQFYGAAGRFATGRGKEIMEFQVPGKNSGNWKKFPTLQSLMDDKRWWPMCFDVTGQKMGPKQRNTWSEDDMKNFCGLFADQPLIVFVPSFFDGPRT
jgi:hypothetical protein